MIATEIATSGSGVDSSRDCNSVDRVLVDFDSGRVYLDRYVLRTCYGVGVYNSREVIGLRSNS